MRALLDDLKKKGEVDSWTGISIVNRLVVKGRSGAIRALAHHSEIASLTGEM